MFPVLARAIHSLAKTGVDLYIDPSEEGVAFRTVNSSRSAFVSYTFKPSFFSSYAPKRVADLNSSRLDIATYISQHQNQNATQVNESNPGILEDSKCKVTMRVSKLSHMRTMSLGPIQLLSVKATIICINVLQGIMVALKSISQLEKTAESCLITVCNKMCKLKIRMNCKYNVTKTYTLPFIESESLMVRVQMHFNSVTFRANKNNSTEV